MDLEPKKESINNLFPDLKPAEKNKTETVKALETAEPIGTASASPRNFMPKSSRFYDPANPIKPVAGDNAEKISLPDKSMVNVFGEAPAISKNKISKKSLTGIIIIFLLLAAAAGIIIVKGEELGILRPKPEKVLSQMAENMKGIKTSRSEGVGQLVVTNNTTPGQSLNMGFKLVTSEDSTDAENLKASLNYDLSLAMEGMSFTANFDLTAVDKVAYFRLNKAPLLPFIDLGKFKGKWIKVDPKEIEKLNPSLGESLKNVETSEKMNLKIKELIQKYQDSLVKVQKELPDEKVDGVSAYSYAIALDKTAVRQLFNELRTISEEAMAPQNSNTNSATNANKSLPSLPEAQTKMIDAQYKLFDERISLISDKADIKIVIGKKDKLMHAASVKFNLTGKEISDIAAKISGSSNTSINSKEAEGLALDLNFDIKYSDFNKAIDIKTPENAEDFMKALGIDESLALAKKKANDARRTVDLQSLRAPLMLYQDDNNGIYPISKGIEKTNDKNSAIYKLVPKYISNIPIDPLNPNYYYGYKSDGKTYELTARAEDTTSNPGKCNKINENLCLITVKSE